MKKPVSRKEAQDIQIDAGVLLGKMGFRGVPIGLRATEDGYCFLMRPGMVLRVAQLAWKGYQAERSARTADAACVGASESAG